MRIWLSGCGGMMGSHLCGALAAAGHEVLASYYKPTVDFADLAGKDDGPESRGGLRPANLDRLAVEVFRPERECLRRTKADRRHELDQGPVPRRHGCSRCRRRTRVWCRGGGGPLRMGLDSMHPPKLPKRCARGSSPCPLLLAFLTWGLGRENRMAAAGPGGEARGVVGQPGPAHRGVSAVPPRGVAGGSGGCRHPRPVVAGPAAFAGRGSNHRLRAGAGGNPGAHPVAALSLRSCGLSPGRTGRHAE